MCSGRGKSESMGSFPLAGFVGWAWKETPGTYKSVLSLDSTSLEESTWEERDFLEYRCFYSLCSEAMPTKGHCTVPAVSWGPIWAEQGLL